MTVSLKKDYTLSSVHNLCRGDMVRKKSERAHWIAVVNSTSAGRAICTIVWPSKLLGETRNPALGDCEIERYRGSITLESDNG